MNKNELITSASEISGVTKKTTEEVVKATLTAIETALQNGEKVKIPGFGTFEIRSRSARVGKNPQTGEKVEIPATKAPVFKAGKALKDAVNK